MKHLIFLVAAVLPGLIIGCAPEEQSKPGDLILINARVYTLDWGDPAPDGTLMPEAPRDERGWHPDADAVVVTGGEIAFVEYGAGGKK